MEIIRYRIVLDSSGLNGSISGHNAIDKILSSPDVDVLAGPIDYHDRALGGPAAYMSAVDSVAARGKLWISEDDTRTHLISPDTRATFPAKEANSESESLGILSRNLASVLIDGTGTWWMDLGAEGSFEDQTFWNLMRAVRTRYSDRIKVPGAYTPDIALIVDAETKNYIASDWDAFSATLLGGRNHLDRVGASIGYYLVNDFIQGRTPPAKVYVFVNCFRLSNEQIIAAQRRLQLEGPMVIWHMAPGYLGGDQPDVFRTSYLTGISATVKNGKVAGRGVGEFQDVLIEEAVSDEVRPRLVIEDADASPLAKFADGSVLIARKKIGTVDSILISHPFAETASPGMLRVIRTLARSAGAWIWTEDAVIIQTDNTRLLTVHNKAAEDMRLQFLLA